MQQTFVTVFVIRQVELGQAWKLYFYFEIFAGNTNVYARQLEYCNSICTNMSLTGDQYNIFKLYSNGFSFFLTGQGGTGKSFVLRHIVETARKEFGEEAVAVTAPTGIAAKNIGGKTIQSWAGVGLANGTRYQLLNKVLASEEARSRWIKCKFLVVDEVSLLSLDLFEKLEFIARRLKETISPFGGIQLIFSGDFYQIPPVNENSQKPKFCFQSSMWEKCFDFSAEISEVVRQSESKFVEFLNEIREGGSLSSNATSLLNSLTRPIKWSKGEPVLKLFALREDAQNENNKMLHLLPGEEHVFNAKDGGQSKYLIDKKCPAPKTLRLKVGAPVMLIKNSPDFELVNVSIGIVGRFVHNYPLVKFDDGKTRIVRENTWTVGEGHSITSSTRRQLPLVLAWAITIHKCQGLTLSKAEINLSNLFVQGQAYVALSRVKTLNGIYVEPGFDLKFPTVSPHVIHFYKEFVTPVNSIEYADTVPKRKRMALDTGLSGNEDHISNCNQLCVEQHDPSKIVNTWEGIIPLPANIDAKAVLIQMVNDELISNETKTLLNTIGFNKDSLPKMLSNFISFIWMKLDEMITMPKTDEVVVV